MKRGPRASKAVFTIDDVSTSALYLRNRKHVPCFYQVIETRVEVWENEKCCGNTSRRRVFPQRTHSLSKTCPREVLGLKHVDVGGIY